MQPLSTSERAVLDRVNNRDPGYMSPRALEALIERGLIVRSTGGVTITDEGRRALGQSPDSHR